MVAGVVGIVAAVSRSARVTGMRLNGEATGTTTAGRLVPELLAATTTILVVEHNTVVAGSGSALMTTSPSPPCQPIARRPPPDCRPATMIYVAVDGQPVGSVKEVVRDIRLHHPGDTCVLDVVRGGESVQVTATLGKTRTD